MKKTPTLSILLLIGVCFFMSHISIAQTGLGIQWQKCIGGTGQDTLFSIEPTSDGGYICAGSTQTNTAVVNHGSRDAWVVKLDNLGNIEWQKSYGGQKNDVAYSIIETIDGNYIFAGYTRSNDGDVVGYNDLGQYADGTTPSDYWVVKLNGVGNIIWQKCIGTAGEQIAKIIRQKSDGNYLICGYISNTTAGNGVPKSNGGKDIWVVGIDNNANIVQGSYPTYGGTGDEEPFCMEIVQQGGYIIGGITSSQSYYGCTNPSCTASALVIKVGTGSSNPSWTKLITNIQSNGGYDRITAIIQRESYSGGGFMALGNLGKETANSVQSGYSVAMALNDGSTSSSNAYIGEKIDGIGSAVISGTTQLNTRIVISGVTTSDSVKLTSANVWAKTKRHGGKDVWMLMANGNGVVNYQKCFGGSGNDESYCVRKTNDGGYISAGYTFSNNGDVTGKITGTYHSDGWVVKFQLCDNTTSTQNITACNSYNFNGQVLSNSGTYTTTIPNTLGCDSIITLNLTVLQPATATDVRTICTGGSLQWINGNTYTSTNTTATHTLVNGAKNGCDSIIKLNLTVLQPITSTDVRTICTGGSLQWINGNTYTSANTTATHILANGAKNGCDSIVTLNLTVLPPLTGTDVQTICAGKSLQWIDGNTYTSANNTATHTLKTVGGCDSIITLHLTVNAPSSVQNETICQGETFTFFGQSLTETGTYTHTLQNSNDGCDSTVTLSLNVSSATPTISQVDGNLVTQTSASYQWFLNGSPISGATSKTYTPTQDGDYTVQVTNNNGCTGTSAVFTVGGVGIAELEKQAFVLFPNPATNSVTVSANETIQTATISDVFGKVVLRHQNNGTSSVILPLSDISSGVYFVRVETERGIGVKKLVVE